MILKCHLFNSRRFSPVNIVYLTSCQHCSCVSGCAVHQRCEGLGRMDIHLLRHTGLSFFLSIRLTASVHFHFPPARALAYFPTRGLVCCHSACLFLCLSPSHVAQCTLQYSSRSQSHTVTIQWS